MASEIKSDKLSPSTGTALQIGDASDTITIPTGATFTITDGLGVAGGGTGLTGFTAGDVLYATGTTTLAKLAKGTAEQVLAMNSGATAPDWGSVDLTVLPTITVAKGGTNLTSFTAGDVLYATGSTTLAKLAKGSASDVLTMNSGATAPEWAAAAGGGKLGQVVQTVKTTVTTQSGSSGTWVDVTGMTVAITPAAATSKILVMLDARTSITGGYGQAVKIQRDVNGGGYADIYVTTDALSSQLTATYGNIMAGGSAQQSPNYVYLDSPTWTTGAITYKMQWQSETSSNIYLNRTRDDSNSTYYWRGASSITAMEILA
jgi:hypothetical protein